ncbi:MAG: hypothetical protein ABEK59_10750 [Halobacteria archaeon]
MNQHLGRRSFLSGIAAVTVTAGCIFDKNVNLIGTTVERNGMEITAKRFHTLESINTTNKAGDGGQDRFHYEKNSPYLIVQLKFKNDTDRKKGLPKPENFGTNYKDKGKDAPVPKSPVIKYSRLGDSYPAYQKKAEDKGYSLKPGESVQGWLRFSLIKNVAVKKQNIVIYPTDTFLEEELKWRLARQNAFLD